MSSARASYSRMGVHLAIDIVDSFLLSSPMDAKSYLLPFYDACKEQQVNIHVIHELLVKLEQL